MQAMLRNRILLSIVLLLIQYWSTAAQTSISTDHSALLALKSHITNDPQNMILTNWSTPSSICNWIGVTCGARHLRVTALNLSYMDVTGTIPPQLGNLSFLVELRFRNNSFYGTIPQELSRLRRLKILNFGFNNFKGTIPSWLGAVSKLQIVSLYGNQFSGLIPTNIFNLSAVQQIDLRFNELSGSIPREIGNLTMMKSIGLDSNNLREFPNEIGTLDQLEEISVQDNALEGHLPGAIFNMSSLTALALTGNSLNGRLPDNICQHLPSIQKLYLSHNQFVGPLPSKLWQCKELAELAWGYNNFSGSIPKNIGNLTQIKYIHLGYNNLTEYGTEGIVTRRGDVYSFGVVLMETFTKRKPTDEMFAGETSLKQWVANSLLSDAIVEVVDANLLGTENDFSFVSKIDCLSSIMRLALSCCAESPEGRINMQDAVVALNKIMIKFLKDATGGVVLRRHLAQQPL